MLIDSHCHLYSKEFSVDVDEVIGRAQRAGVQQFYLPSVDSSSTEQLLSLESLYPGVCIPMIGLHPCSVKDDYEKELQFVDDWLAHRNFAAIGEAGLDFYWDKTFEKQQYLAINHQIKLAIKHDLPIIIHTRSAMIEMINVIKSYDGKLKGIFHCFGGSLDEANEIIKLGFLLGIGGVVTYKNSGLQEVLCEIDLKNIVLETDAPYLSPVPFRGKRNESSYLNYICDKVAEIKKIPPGEVAAITTANAIKMFAG